MKMLNDSKSPVYLLLCDNSKIKFVQTVIYKSMQERVYHIKFKKNGDNTKSKGTNETVI